MQVTQRFAQLLTQNVGNVIVGKSAAVELIMIAMLCKGHVLIEDVPGVGKTTLASALAKSIDCSFKRIQFTPDITPSDITGFSIVNMKTGELEYRKGLVMSQMVLCDEINRTSPKTQSSLLEVMEEGQVTVDGVTYAMPQPFMVLATQNPVDFVGTYPLPEAQLDRFFMRVSIGYPTADEEADILERYSSGARPLEKLEPICSSQDILKLQQQVEGVYAAKEVRVYIAAIAAASRKTGALELGVSTRAAIQANHSMMVHPEACAGNLDTNPLRRDLEQAAAICGVDFIVNVVLDEHKQIVRAVAGDLTLAHREGCRFLDGMYLKEIDSRADIVIVSQGGAPKDLNLYQTQKALDNAKHAVKKGGTIILIGSCKEGLGEKVFEEWMLNAPTAESMIERIGRDFQLGGHKAAAIAMVLQNAEIYLVSDLEDDFVKKIFLKPAHSAQEALDAAFARLGPDATVLAMPYGGSTLPRAKA